MPGLGLEELNTVKLLVRVDDSAPAVNAHNYHNCLFTLVLILGGIKNEPQLNILLNRMLELLSSPFMIDGQNVSISASVGVTIYPRDNSVASDLLAHADSAMYAAKNQGKNSWKIYAP
mgnify:CR=1 FL=1